MGGRSSLIHVQGINSFVPDIYIFNSSLLNEESTKLLSCSFDTTSILKKRFPFFL